LLQGFSVNRIVGPNETSLLSDKELVRLARVKLEYLILNHRWRKMPLRRVPLVALKTLLFLPPAPESDSDFRLARGS
jgi:hypothetical protein